MASTRTSRRSNNGRRPAGDPGTRHPNPLCGWGDCWEVLHLQQGSAGMWESQSPIRSLLLATKIALITTRDHHTGALRSPQLEAVRLLTLAIDYSLP